VNTNTRWLYCVECPQYSTRLEALGYLCDCLSGRDQRQPSVTDWQSDRQTDRPRYSVRCGVIMRNDVGYGKATQSFHVSTNSFATIKSLSVRLNS